MVVLLKALRPDQWIKNVVVFAALIFAAELGNKVLLFHSLLAFVIFCLASSAVYLFNDVCDRERDSRHPIKMHRPIASGQVSVKTALIFSAILTIIILVPSFLMWPGFGVIVAGYIVINVLYSLVLKNIVILDVMVIALGFVLRAVGGGMIINVHISPWLILCTLLLALFLGFAKRRHELELLKETAQSHRFLLREYSPYFLDQMIAVVTTSTLILYILYTMLGELKVRMKVQYLELTIPFVLYGIFRYLYLVHQKRKGGSPTQTLLRDPHLLVNVVLWAAVAIFLIYR
jgi:4-hydroxybenzoate polyprenyltransferase